MPHIAISKDGEVGKVYREGIDTPSHACGSLEVIVNELRTGHFNMFLDLEDLEESLIRQKILSHLKYGVKPDLIKMTKLACNIISMDSKHLLLKNLDSKVFHYAVMTGIMIHGPNDSNWVYPRDFYLERIYLIIKKKLKYFIPAESKCYNRSIPGWQKS